MDPALESTRGTDEGGACAPLEHLDLVAALETAELERSNAVGPVADAHPSIAHDPSFHARFGRPIEAERRARDRWADRADVTCSADRRVVWRQRVALVRLGCGRDMAVG